MLAPVFCPFVLNIPCSMFGSAAVLERCLSVFGFRPETLCQAVMR